ncbi:hypothetical protein D9619_012106 [Psilocybe cf. subviscida]|uniref:PPM-type phosphatase domain-containing protein n=1 Tax=Psilocybe cf. subviscida TaxID=2480587 RepID=A0A8H5EZS6_9AGAR|nr:hypothetical protein D9619_012106 [Psilocybe cf. subviscida]
MSVTADSISPSPLTYQAYEPALRKLTGIPYTQPLHLTSLPPQDVYNLSILAALAIWGSPSKQLSLSQIREQIEVFIPHYADADFCRRVKWKDSLRHRLSHKDMFVHVPNPMKPGSVKSGFWTVVPTLTGNTRNRRKTSDPAARTERVLSRTPLVLFRQRSTLHNNGSQSRRRVILVTLGSTAAAGLFFANSNVTHNDSAQQPPEDHPEANAPSTELFISVIMQNAQSVRPSPLGLGRIDVMTLASNNPIEDFNSTGSSYFSPTTGFHTCGIYDGHNGVATAGILTDILPLAVTAHLADLYSRHAAISDSIGIDVSGGVSYQAYERSPGEPPDPVPPPEEIDEAIRKAFCDVDELLVHETAAKVLGLSPAEYDAIRAGEPYSRTDVFQANVVDVDRTSLLKNALTTLAPALAGSCAIMGIFNSADRSLRVALTGDSRAVWGRRVPSPSNPGSYVYEAQALSVDQNARNPAEAARLTAFHPDEPELLKNNRVLGWGPARAFGDGAMKWSQEVQKRLREDFLGDRPRDTCKTPPYFTPEPVITTKENIQRGDFVIYGSDGLWDSLESEEVVGLVGQWLEEYGAKEQVPDGTEIIRPPPIPTFGSQEELLESQRRSDTKLAPSQLPVVYPAEYKDRTAMYKYWKKEKVFVCKDMNVGVHLVRNALGGADTDLREALLSLGNPRSRRFRDDITVMVVFYD